MVDPVTVTQLAKKLGEFLIKSNPIAALLKPWQLKRIAKAEAQAQRYKKLLSAQNKKDVEAINSGTHVLNKEFELIPVSEAENINKDGYDFSELFIKAMNEELIQEKIREITNVSIAIEHAEQILQQDTSSPSDDELDIDWFNRWKDMAAKVSNEDMQSLWGNILANAIKTPKSASLRTLTFFQDLDHDTAIILNSLASLVMCGNTISTVLAQNHYKLEDLLFLEELGIIQAVNSPLMLNKTFEPQGNGKFYCVLDFNDILYIARAPISQLFNIECYYLTSLGENILKFATYDRMSVNIDNMVSELILKNKFEVSYTKIFQKVNGIYHWNTNSEIRVN